MKRLLLALALFFSVPLPFALAEKGDGESLSLIASEETGTTQAIEITGKDGKARKLDVELAVTPEEQAHGLMFRKSMPENHGMMFVFGNESLRTFWMKNTLISLDILFLNADGKIVKIHENAKPLDETRIPSEEPVFAAIELNGGAAARLGISAGDIVHHDTFGNSSSK